MKKVIIYTTTTCVYCRAAKAFFQEKQVPYEERDVMENEQARQEMLDKSHQIGVPVIDIEGEIFVGFDKGAIAEALGIG